MGVVPSDTLACAMQPGNAQAWRSRLGTATDAIRGGGATAVEHRHVPVRPAEIFSAAQFGAEFNSAERTD